MKKSILTIALALVATVGMAQDKKGTEVKPVYQPNMQMMVPINFKVTAQQLNNFLLVEQFGSQLDASDKLTGAQITQLKTGHKLVLDSINNRFTAFIKADQEKFTRDTTALYHPKPKK